MMHLKCRTYETVQYSYFTDYPRAHISQQNYPTADFMPIMRG